MSKSVIEVLTEARSLVERGWTQMAWARDSRGRHCDWNNACARFWCITGALALAFPGSMDKVRGVVWRILRELVPGGGLMSWNDAPGRTQAEVVALFDKAIERAKAHAPDALAGKEGG